MKHQQDWDQDCKIGHTHEHDKHTMRERGRARERETQRERYRYLSTLPSPLPISTCFLSGSEPNVPRYQEGAHDSSIQDTETQNIRLHSHSSINLYVHSNLPTFSPTYVGPHVQAWLSWSEQGTVNPSVVGSIPSKNRELKFPWICTS